MKHLVSIINFGLYCNESFWMDKSHFQIIAIAALRVPGNFCTEKSLKQLIIDRIFS